ncbi:MAG: type II secretion system F family protein [Candidatus Omnitrophota bacterium]
MPIYSYIARNKSGKRFKNMMGAVNQNELAEKLAYSGLILISAEEEEFFKSKGKIRVKFRQLIDFTTNLTALLKSGITLLDALNALAQDARDVKIASLMIALRDHVEAGGSFKGAISLFPKVFPKVYIAMIEAGEKTGKLSYVLELLTSYLEWQADLKTRIKELATYPTIVFCVMIIVIIILVGWVLPKFEPILKELGGELPLPTKIVLGISHFFINYWYIGLIGMGVIAFILWFLLRYEKVRFALDVVKLKIPVIGGLIHQLCLVRIFHSLSLGLSSGIGIIENLDLVKDTAGNRLLAKALASIRDSVSSGGQMAAAFSVTEVFPPMAIRMVEVGERSASLVTGFTRLSEYYDKEILRTIKQIFTIMEPVLIVVMGIAVGGVALSVFLPLIKMTQLMGA